VIGVTSIGVTTRWQCSATNISSLPVQQQWNCLCSSASCVAFNFNASQVQMQHTNARAGPVHPASVQQLLSSDAEHKHMNTMLLSITLPEPNALLHM
jgi:hypothetical protein